jgi:hypothetical protein
MLAAALIACSLPTSTQSFKIDLSAYPEFAYVERYQYPATRKQFYPIKEERDVNGVHEIVLYNPEIYFQAERTLILRLGPKPTLEVFWIRGSTGFGAGGESGSVFYDCAL